MITEDKLDAKSLLLQADRIMENDDLRAKMSAASKKMGRPDAADRLIKVLHTAIDEHH